jgi:hypothetical protein
VLHRSAASLAVECFQLREAERLIGRALAGNPPPDIADELRDLLLNTGNNASMFLVKSMKFEKIFAVQSNHCPIVSRSERQNIWILLSSPFCFLDGQYIMTQIS